jgi:integrase
MAKVHLTKSFIESIQSEDKRLSFTDDKARGLTLLVTPNGVKTYYLTRKYRGKVERTLLGHFPELTLAQARTRAAQHQVQYDAGINPNEAKRKARLEPTLDEFFKIYYQDHCLMKNKRPENSRGDYMRYLSPTLGNMQLSQIKRTDIKQVMNGLGAQGYQRTANIAQGLVRAMYNKALAWEYFDGNNPAEHIERYRERPRKRVLQPDEVPRLHEALALEPDEVNRDAILLLMYTGARKSNVLSMHWLEIDLDKALWLIPETKNGEAHLTVLTPEALSILRRRKKQTSSVFVLPGRGRTGHVENLKKAWGRLLDHAGIEDLRLHDLRRTVGSWMANAGANQAQIQLQLGHMDAQSAKAYVHPDVEYVRDSMSKVTHLLAPKTRK